MTTENSKPWHKSAIVVIDVETTGTGPDARCVEIAAVRIENRAIVAKWSSLVNPGCAIPAEATAVHGITDEMVKDAPSLALLAADLHRLADGAVPCAFNADFDKRIIHQEINGNECPLFMPEAQWLDCYVMAWSQDKYVPGAGRLKLTEVCKRRGINIVGAHRALHDAMATSMLLLSFLGSSESTIEGLLARTAKVKGEQEADYRAWKKKQMTADQIVWRQYACAALAGLCAREQCMSLQDTNGCVAEALYTADSMLAAEKERFQ